jgi:predicted ATP-binding protein involved in virulence
MKIESLTTIKSLKIEKLFEIFDYHVKYPKKDNVLIITGPNGFGKTQVLNIIYSLFNKRFAFFYNLVFKKITVTLNSGLSIVICKKNEQNEKVTVFKLLNENKVYETFNYTYAMDRNLLRSVEQYLPLSRMRENVWLDHKTDNLLTDVDVISKYADVISEYANQLPAKMSDNLKGDNEELLKAFKTINVHLIREQRLFKKVDSRERNYRGERNQTIMIETIQTYANELRELISGRIQQSFSISQSLDSSYPNRLISGKKKVSKNEYDQKFANLKEKQEKLTRNGLYENTQKELNYSEDDAKALLVYLNDLEKKLEVFDGLLEKLELFTSILNKRRFTFKSINISREKGFYFKTSKGKELKLNQLSSGEQHEVVLLYELIFKTSPNILVLIDEPEISLHITWQKEFLDDLLKIIKIQNFQVLIATHSPSIINDRWDLVYNLEKTENL